MSSSMQEEMTTFGQTLRNFRSRHGWKNKSSAYAPTGIRPSTWKDSSFSKSLLETNSTFQKAKGSLDHQFQIKTHLSKQNFKWNNQFHFLNITSLSWLSFLLFKVETPLVFDAIYSCPGLALLCQVRFCFFLKGIPWSDLGVRFVTLPLFNCLCTHRRCEDG